MANDIHQLNKGEHRVFIVGKPSAIGVFLKDIWHGNSREWTYKKKSDK